MAKGRKKKKKGGYRPKTRITSFLEAYRRLIDFIKNPARKRLRHKAQARFETLIEIEEILEYLIPYFLDWAVFDYRETERGPTVVERFIEEHPEFDQATKERFLSCSKRGIQGFFTVTEQNQDGSFIVQELGAEKDEGYLVKPSHGSTREKGSVLEGRLVPWEDHWFFSISMRLEDGEDFDLSTSIRYLREIRQRYDENEWRQFVADFKPRFLSQFVRRQAQRFLEATAEASKRTKEDLELQNIAVLVERGDINRAKVAAERLLAKVPGHAEVASLLSQIYEEEGNLSKSREVLERALTVNPDDVELRLELARLQAANAQFGAAMRTLEPVKDLFDHPLRNEIRCLHASCLYKIGQTEQGKAIFSSVLEEAPENALCVERMAMLLLSAHEYKEAENALARHLEVVEEANPRIYLVLGYCHYRETNWAKALAALDRIPESARASVIFALIGECAFQLERYTQARYAYERLLETDADLPDDHRGVILQRLAFIQWQRGMHERALPLLHEAITVDPDNPDALWLLAEVYLARREMDLAGACVVEMMERFPDHPLLQSLVARLFPGALRSVRKLPPYGARRARRRFRCQVRGT